MKSKSKNQIEEVIFQPYGKDDVCINFLIANKVLAFGVSDVEDLDEISRMANINSYIQINGKNPRYYKVIESDFKIKNDSNAVFESRTLTKVKSLYIVLIYNRTDEFLYMRYVESEDEYAIVKNKFNVLASFIFLGGNLRVVDQDLVNGIGYSHKKIAALIKNLETTP